MREIGRLDPAHAIVAQQARHATAPVQQRLQPRHQREAAWPAAAGSAQPACSNSGRLADGRARRRFQHRHDVGAAVEQLRRGLQAQRPVARDHDALARRHAVGARQGLQRADRHHAGQGPARHRQRLFVGAGRQHQAPGPEQGRPAGDDGGHLGRREGRPHRGLVEDTDAGPQRRLVQRRTVAELAIEMPALGELRGRQRLEELAAGMQPLVGNDDVGAGPGEVARRRQAGRARADHQHVAGDLLGRGGRRHRPAARRSARRARPCRRRPWSGRRAGWAGRRPSPGSRSRRPCRRTARAARPTAPAAPTTMSAAARAAAMVSPVSASISAPSKRRRTGAPAGRMFGCFRRMADGLQWPQRGTT